MAVLPDDVLFVEIFGKLTGHVAILWAVCKRWHAEARKLQVRPVQHPLSTIAAEGHLSVLAWFRGYYYDSTLTSTEIDLVLEIAAKRGHERVCLQMKKWYPSSNCIALLIGAAAGGHVPLCQLAKSLDWQVSESWTMATPLALRRAAEGGFENVCRLIKEWIDSEPGPTSDFASAFASDPNPLVYNMMLEGAALGGHLPLCHLAKRWGASNFRAMRAAAKLRTRDPADEIRCLAQEWLSLAHDYGMAGQIFRLITNDSKADRMLMNTEVLDRRLAEIREQQDGALPSSEAQESKTPTD